MIADTSAWIEYLRATGSPVHHRLRAAIAAGDDIVVPDPVVMELLAGARDDRHAVSLTRLLFAFSVESVAPFDDAERAAALFRTCRRGGDTVRSLVDCLIGAIAVRLGQPVLAVDRDFDVLARHTSVELVAEGDRPGA